MSQSELAQAVRLREPGRTEEARRALVEPARCRPDDAEVTYYADNLDETV
jgi:hypothetical protein